MVNVTKSNFIEQSNDLLEYLPSAAFIAIDEEMTGIALPGTGRPPKDQTPAQRYPILKRVPERYSIIQLGISLFHYNHHHDVAAAAAQEEGEQEEGRWKVRKYNFYLFPGGDSGYFGNYQREVVMNPGTVAFLNKHNMNFDLWTKQGIPFQTRRQAAETIEAYIKKEKTAMELAAATAQANNNGQHPTVQQMLQRRIELRRTDDIDFYARTMASLREWLDAAHTTRNHHHHHNNPAAAVGGGNSILLPPCNSFLRRALYENIGKEYPSLILEKAGPDHPNQIRVLRLNDAEKRARQERLRREAWQELLVEKIGMWRVVDALCRVCQGQDIPQDDVLFAPSVDQVDWDNVVSTVAAKQASLQNHRGNDHDEEEDEELTTTTTTTTTTRATTTNGRKIPLVVHNGFMDILFLMTHFFCDNDNNNSNKLPDSLEDCKALISSCFPVIYDTKVMSTECTMLYNNDSSNLANLYQKVIVQGGNNNNNNNNRLLDKIDIVRATAQLEDGEIIELEEEEDQEHEASYDAYMTGAVFIGLSLQIKQERFQHNYNHNAYSSSSHNDVVVVGPLRHLLANEDDKVVHSCYGRNKLYQMSLFTLDLEEATDNDPLSRGMLPESTFRVAGIDPSVSTRDIVRCMNGMFDDTGRRVNFDIIWVDDTTFLVAASYRPTLHPRDNNNNERHQNHQGAAAAAGEDAENETLILKEHGRLVHRALSNRFLREEIVSLDEYFRQLRQASVAKEQRGWVARLLELLGLGKKKKRGAEDDAAPAAKRRRQS